MTIYSPGPMPTSEDLHDLQTYLLEELQGIGDYTEGVSYSDLNNLPTIREREVAYWVGPDEDVAGDGVSSVFTGSDISLNANRLQLTGGGDGFTLPETWFISGESNSDFDLVVFPDGRVRVTVANPGSDDFTDAVEGSLNFRLTQGSNVLTVTGGTGSDTAEPYLWTPTNSAEVTAFYEASNGDDEITIEFWTVADEGDLVSRVFTNFFRDDSRLRLSSGVFTLPAAWFVSGQSNGSFTLELRGSGYVVVNVVTSVGLDDFTDAVEGSLVIRVAQGTNVLTVTGGTIGDHAPEYSWVPANSDEVIAFYNASNADDDVLVEFWTIAAVLAEEPPALDDSLGRRRSHPRTAGRSRAPTPALANTKWRRTATTRCLQLCRTEFGEDPTTYEHLETRSNAGRAGVRIPLARSRTLCRRVKIRLAGFIHQGIFPQWYSARRLPPLAAERRPTDNCNSDNSIHQIPRAKGRRSYTRGRQGNAQQHVSLCFDGSLWCRIWSNPCRD